MKDAVMERETVQDNRLPSYTPTREEVDALILRARQHPLGLDFLKTGALEAAAIIFEAHVFAVESARQRLA